MNSVRRMGRGERHHRYDYYYCNGGADLNGGAIRDGNNRVRDT
jgi:hypothetical protein